VSDLVSLMDHVQARLELIDAAMASQADSEPELADVVLLDDVTPLYGRARDALELCNVSLRAALQFLLDARPTISQA
jgi:hypothetical protein